jgi:hypothetical protein
MWPPRRSATAPRPPRRAAALMWLRARLAAVSQRVPARMAEPVTCDNRFTAPRAAPRGAPQFPQNLWPSPRDAPHRAHLSTRHLYPREVPPYMTRPL